MMQGFGYTISTLYARAALLKTIYVMLEWVFYLYDPGMGPLYVELAWTLFI